MRDGALGIEPDAVLIPQAEGPPLRLPLLDLYVPLKARLELPEGETWRRLKLAGRALKKGAVVLGPTGKPFTEQSIGMALAMRELNQHLRETGESKGYNAGFTSKDRASFLQAFDAAVQRAKRSG